MARAPEAAPEAGTVTTEQAMLLLLLDKQSDLKALEREGAFKQIAPDRYWLKDLVQGFVRHARETRNITTTAVLADVFGQSPPRASTQLARQGIFTQITHGTFNWTDACGGYIKMLRAEDRKSTRSAADSRIKDAKAKDIETRTMQRLSRLIPLEVYEEMIDSIAGMVRSEFAGLAATCTRDLNMRRIIEREVNARLNRISEHALAQAIRLEKAGGADEAIAAAGA